uniref:Uncharacterized protein n=1 Tax=Oryza rufipogon TaxID=4529 RepID=A0A0E0N1E5_ORYRU
MGAMGKLRVFVVQEPVVAASCLIAGFGLSSCLNWRRGRDDHKVTGFAGAIMLRGEVVNPIHASGQSYSEECPQDCSSVVSIGHEQSVSLVLCPKLLPRLECHGGGKEDPHRVSATQRTSQETQLPQVRESGLAVKRGKRRRDWV